MAVRVAAAITNTKPSSAFLSVVFACSRLSGLPLLDIYWMPPITRKAVQTSEAITQSVVMIGATYERIVVEAANASASCIGNKLMMLLAESASC